MSTRTVTYDLTLITGSAAASKVVTFDLLTPLAARSTDTVVQITFSSTADENGAGTVTLAVPSSGAYLYSCTLPDGQSFRFSLAAGDATTLHALMAATVGSTVTAADAITAAVDAAITTHNALTTNVHGIADTSDIEPALGNPDADGYVLSSTAAGVRSWVQSAADVDDLTTATGSSTNMLRVAAAGGLEYRTAAQVLSDIGAAPAASPTFTGTVTLPTTVASVIKPSSDSATALQLTNAAGTNHISVNTTSTSLVFSNGTTTGLVGWGSNASYFGLWAGGNTAAPTNTNCSLQSTATTLVLNGPGSSGSIYMRTNNADTVLAKDQKIFVGGSTTPTATVDIIASTTSAASLRIRSGTAPTSPNAGDIWNDGTDFNLYGSGLKLHTGVIKPASDSTTALQLANAAGTAVLTVDTTNGRVGVGVTPTFTFDVLGTSTVISQIKASSSGSFSAAIVAANTAQFQLYAFGSTRGGTSYGGVTTNSQVAIIGTSASSMYIANSSQSAPVILGSQTILDASTTAAASLRIRSGTAPTTPNAGDIWFDGTNLKMYDGTTTRTISWT